MPYSLLRMVGVVCLMTGGTVFAAEPAIIAKARALLAPDAVLDAVRSLHYVGTLTAQDPSAPTKQVRQGVEIFLEKPARQRIVVTSADAIEVSALDGYDAWRRNTDAKDPAKWQQNQMSAEQIKQLRADVWENLAFYRGLEQIGGRIEDQGDATIDGIACRKIAFYHPGTVSAFFRYFNASTGKLVYTGTAENNIREEGELVAGGIRFPKTITVTQTVNGQTIARKITFDKITVNETFPASLFAVPLPTVK